MNISRRKFVRAGTVSALLAGLSLSSAKSIFGQKQKSPGVGGFALPYAAKTDPVFYFSRETFAPYMNTTFRIASRQKGAAFDATLVEVFDYQAQAHARKVKTHEGNCFALTFRAGERDTLSQGTYKFVHPALGSFSLFVVPGKPSADGTTYEAVVNHLA
jgi:hypothetical protein